MASPAETAKVLSICQILNSTPAKMTPKRFMEIFLESPDSEIAYLRRLWAQPIGLPSTMRLMPLLRNEVHRTKGGYDLWSSFIQQEAINILVSQEAPRGYYPRGSFHSSLSVTNLFFTEAAQRQQEITMTAEYMPFLFGLIMGMLNRPGVASDAMDDEDAREAANVLEETEEGVSPSVAEEFGEVAYVQSLTRGARRHARNSRIATTICSVVAFAHNRRHNPLQLKNAVRLFACGASERVHEYFHHLGMCSSRKTALSALRTLTRGGEGDIRSVMALQRHCPIAPTICIDNIDMEQRVHDLSVGNRSNTFRGTWGYIHVPNPSLTQSLDFKELTLEAYQAAMAHVWKSQIAQVLLEHIAIPSKKSKSIPTDPPTLDQISHEKPIIQMLKLMDASDNSAEGIGQVFSSIVAQSGLTPEEFYGRLQPMDGDLGTIQNFNSLRSQRAPSSYGENNLNNVVFQLGASHTLWNIGSTIFTHHFGDSHDELNIGAWQYLEALGFPSEKAIQKKDFTLMINQMEKAMEATLYYCLRVILKKEHVHLGAERATLPTEKWNAVVNECYERFCSPEARRKAANLECPKLSNTLIQLHDFSSVVEAKRSMRAGDIGRLTNVWKKWCLMTQGLTGLTNYLSYLPRQVLMLTQFLPPALQKYLSHNLLISPSGRSNHFVAKDFWLEVKNYWLKFIFNNTGKGTVVDRLRELFSVNIDLLQLMFQSLKTDCGLDVVHQSHKNVLTSRSLAMFMQMANNKDILDLTPSKKPRKTAKIENTYLTGFAKMKKNIRTKDPELKKLKKHLFTDQPGSLTREDDTNENEDDDARSEDM
ncbi:hypothetical protein PSTG_01050 [Puccinia striiformis f. sp. tritici PST-78]|uniref:DUF6589 domain-containing protein n=1 Tax=Puccinia striiformis f. sp. tritici PST-78 TaxID=1165861 RepID=A0A0L0W2E6_9BASI|nr:hypothetical protein PSTG_01050 [Puccinia striiformis f. sp. tritici PST-78]